MIVELSSLKSKIRRSFRAKERRQSADTLAGTVKIMITTPINGITALTKLLFVKKTQKIISNLLTAALLSTVFFFIGPGSARPEAADQTTIGAVEDVVLLPWGVRLPARIDTGASTSSLDARDIRVKGKTVEFKLAAEYGGLKIRLPLVRWATVRTAQTAQKRPVVMMELCIGSKRLRTEVNLNDRSAVDYPLLVGRNTIQHNFVVDCSTEYCAQPSCPGVLAQ